MHATMHAAIHTHTGLKSELTLDKYTATSTRHDAARLRCGIHTEPYTHAHHGGKPTTHIHQYTPGSTVPCSGRGSWCCPAQSWHPSCTRTPAWRSCASPAQIRPTDLCRATSSETWGCHSRIHSHTQPHTPTATHTHTRTPTATHTHTRTPTATH